MVASVLIPIMLFIGGLELRRRANEKERKGGERRSSK
jgi:hypothetical protein